jgi:NAD(P)H-hydrate epimerase
MENAARGAAEAAIRLHQEAAGRVVCVAGPGNNGGDALAVARHLAIAGIPVGVAILDGRSGSPPTGDAGVQLSIVEAMQLPLRHLSGASAGPDLARMLAEAALVVDGLFGTGLDRALEGAAADCVAAINGSGVPILSLDVPSGLDCDSGRPLGPCVRATRTVTFVAPKLGFAEPSSREWTGDVVVAGIGAPLDWPPEGGVP